MNVLTVLTRYLFGAPICDEKIMGSGKGDGSSLKYLIMYISSFVHIRHFS